MIAQQGIPSQRVPACVSCHGPSDTTPNPIYPTFAGQYAIISSCSLNFSKMKTAVVRPMHLMRTVATRLTPEQIRAVELYYALAGEEPIMFDVEKMP